MTSIFKDYESALKLAFTAAYGGEAKDWTISTEAKNEKGQAVCDAENKAKNILLHVTDEGEDLVEAGGQKFNAKRDGTSDSMNMTAPVSWKGLKF